MICRRAVQRGYRADAVKARGARDDEVEEAHLANALLGGGVSAVVCNRRDISLRSGLSLLYTYRTPSFVLRRYACKYEPKSLSLSPSSHCDVSDEKGKSRTTAALSLNSWST